MRSQLNAWSVFIREPRRLNDTKKKFFFCDILSDVVIIAGLTASHWQAKNWTGGGRGGMSGINWHVWIFFQRHCQRINFFDCCTHTHAPIYLNRLATRMAYVCVSLSKVGMCFVSNMFFATEPKKKKSMILTIPQCGQVAKITNCHWFSVMRAQFNAKWHILSIEIIERTRQKKKKRKIGWFGPHKK